MSASESVADAVAAICRRLEVEEPVVAREAQAIRERLEGPLRVAIAGRVKAGKSTLLNALVGERLAPTDAGECTRIVTVFSKGMSYVVNAKLRGGEEHPLGFRRTEGALAIELGAFSERDVAHLDVRWPSSALNSLTLIDTPGLASVNDENSRRTIEFLGAGDGGGAASDADAVIYLMRHVHASDVAFLDAFMDRNVPAASPVNAVAVLSRADEIGAGRLDAMESAGRIARRYDGDPQVSSLCSTVTPLAGLLAETGLTLREDEAASLRTLAATEPVALERMLLTADELLDVAASELTVEIRRDLLDRLGMFGIRLAMREVAAGATTAAQLGPRLVAQSGLNELRAILADRFGPRARVLQARTALQSLRRLSTSLREREPRAASTLEREIERLESSTLDFARLRGAHLVASGSVRLGEVDHADVERLLLTPGAAGLRLGNAPLRDVQRVALEQVSRWRSRGADPLADAALTEVCETAARTCESIYVAAAATDGAAAGR